MMLIDCAIMSSFSQWRDKHPTLLCLREKVVVRVVEMEVGGVRRSPIHTFAEGSSLFLTSIVKVSGDDCFTIADRNYI